ncbi:hypothetical protein BDY19DRAFT_938093 [Irpex rosettiformis]|uniref:Uncharacterized protein n=1 Tax=Irpex rosettiformis TaxID=378272 RepID=A0ACB8U9P0_9APHY|nr:hypothetical protein BDY19DRAFT_938093 [Irpex rosettiformis]
MPSDSSDSEDDKRDSSDSEDDKRDWCDLPLEGHRAYKPNEDGRTRYVKLHWVRSKEGEKLPKPGPPGKRPPNNIIWGHDLDELLWIDRFTGLFRNAGVQTIWSRSMIREYGENYIEEAWKLDRRSAIPHFRKPWPVLKLKLPEGDHIGDYVFDEQIGDFNQIWDHCPQGRWVLFSLRPEVPEMAQEDVVDDDATAANEDSPTGSSVVHSELKGHPYLTSNEPTESAVVDNSHSGTIGLAPGETKATAILDTYRPLQMLKEDSDPQCYLGRKQNAYKRQGRTAELRAYFPTYDYKPYVMPDPRVSAPRSSPFSVEDIPKLEETIPDAFMPDYLIVHDPHNVTYCDGVDYLGDSLPSTVPPPRKYQRVLPKISKTDLKIPEVCRTRETIAHLYLHQKNRLGVGNHSLVYRSPLALPPPLSAQSRNGNVVVTAKLAMYNQEDRQMLRHEAMIYDKMPKHMSEDWCGYNLIAPILQPVPVGPVVPKFFGLYEPVGDDKRYPYKRQWSPILLMEECGKPVNPKRLSVDERSVGVTRRQVNL